VGKQRSANVKVTNANWFTAISKEQFHGQRRRRIKKWRM